MPVIDMSLNDLREYKGITPFPTDFDDFWDRSLEEIKHLDENVEFVKVDYHSCIAEMYDLYFAGTKRAKTYSKNQNMGTISYLYEIVFFVIYEFTIDTVLTSA
ncbi:MAG: acetylxylan esterase [Clostridia bacterium]|nr:acetylxylan esterase [Clostridia bacterium]